MAETLNTIERRVLGVLIEKSLAQAQYYPITLNAIVTACNQKSNRDPMMALDEDAIWNTLEVLQAAGLVTRLLPGGASRVDRFKHEVKTRLGWEKPQWAVMAELLLRGPQTVGELRGRCSRMYPFENTDAVAAVLEILSHQDPPRVATLPRAPGQSAIRFAHKLYPPEEWDTIAQPPVSGATVAHATAGAALQPSPRRIGEAGADVERLRQTVENLEGRIAELEEDLSGLRRRVEQLEGR
jgi:uncharacterized protein YceH (UPF0502 family)